MNANELINILEKYTKEGIATSIANANIEKIINVLRHQQDIIGEYIRSTDYWMKLCQEANATIEQQADRIAEWFNDSHYYVHGKEPVNLKDENWTAIPLYTTPQTKPLSFQEMVDCASEAGALWDTHINGDVIFKSVDAFNNFCRAIEERHGIK